MKFPLTRQHILDSYKEKIPSFSAQYVKDFLQSQNVKESQITENVMQQAVSVLSEQWLEQQFNQFVDQLVEKANIEKFL